MMNEMLGYEFFTYQDHEQGKTPMELDPLYFPKQAPLYIEKLCILADDMIDVIKQIENPAAVTTPDLQPTSSRPQVYLAQCSRDQKDAREALEMDLRQHGYAIFPDKQLPNEETEFVLEVSAMLGRCSLSIHLVGGSSGFIPDGSSGKSAVVLQNELAIAQAKKSGMRRVIVERSRRKMSLGSDLNAWRTGYCYESTPAHS